MRFILTLFVLCVELPTFLVTVVIFIELTAMKIIA